MLRLHSCGDDIVNGDNGDNGDNSDNDDIDDIDDNDDDSEYVYKRNIFDKEGLRLGFWVFFCFFGNERQARRVE